MRSIQTAAALLSALAGCGLARPVAAQQFPIERELPASPGQHLEVDLRTGGGISVVGHDAASVRVRVEEGRNGCEACTVAVERTAAGVSVRSDLREGGRQGRSDLRVVVAVPRHFDLELETMGGEIRVHEVAGQIRGRTMGGALELSGLGGRIDLETMGGAVRLTDSDVDGRVHTMGGSVLLEGVRGDVDASSMGGSVTRRGSRGGAGAGDQPVVMRSMGGAIELDAAPAGADVSTMGGDIVVGSAGSGVKAETKGGDITLHAVDGGVVATTMGGDVEVEVVGDAGRAGRDILLESMGGDIELRVPASLSARLEVELDYTAGNEGRYRILSDLPLDQTRAEGDDRGRRYTRRGIGTVGSGTNRVRIRTVNGNVRLRRTES